MTTQKLKTYLFIERHRREKRQAANWKKIFAMHTINKTQYLEYITNSLREERKSKVTSRKVDKDKQPFHRRGNANGEDVLNFIGNQGNTS